MNYLVNGISVIINVIKPRHTNMPPRSQLKCMVFSVCQGLNYLISS